MYSAEERRKLYIETKTNDLNVIGDYSHGTVLPGSLSLQGGSSCPTPFDAERVMVSLVPGSWTACSLGYKTVADI